MFRIKVFFGNRERWLQGIILEAQLCIGQRRGEMKCYYTCTFTISAQEGKRDIGMEKKLCNSYEHLVFQLFRIKISTKINFAASKGRNA